MLKNAFFSILVLLLCSCSPDDTVRDRNPNLLDINFTVSLNTNLPQYSLLQFPGNAVFVGGVANKGVFVVNTGSGIRAFDASDPNHPPSDCSAMALMGIEVTCPCEDATYNLYTGVAVGQRLDYPLLEYRASQSGNLITISN